MKENTVDILPERTHSENRLVHLSCMWKYMFPEAGGANEEDRKKNVLQGKYSSKCDFSHQVRRQQNIAPLKAAAFPSRLSLEFI